MTTKCLSKDCTGERVGQFYPQDSDELTDEVKEHRVEFVIHKSTPVSTSPEKSKNNMLTKLFFSLLSSTYTTGKTENFKL